jgi:hypothetical protein
MSVNVYQSTTQCKNTEDSRIQKRQRQKLISLLVNNTSSYIHTSTAAYKQIAKRRNNFSSHSRYTQPTKVLHTPQQRTLRTTTRIQLSFPHHAQMVKTTVTVKHQPSVHLPNILGMCLNKQMSPSCGSILKGHIGLWGERNNI